MSKYHEAIKNDPRWHQARAACFARDGYQCVMCGSAGPLECDHITPLVALIPSGGDPFNLDNLQTLCRTHNRLKGATITTERIRIEWINPKYRELVDDLAAATPFF